MHDKPAIECDDECGWVAARCESYVDGELSGADFDAVARHVASCEECDRAVRRAALVKQSLRRLPELRCPDEVAIAARRAGDRIHERRRRIQATIAFAVAATLLASVGAWRMHIQELQRERAIAAQTKADVARAKAAVAEAHAELVARLEQAREKTVRRACEQPVQKVAAALRECKLGRMVASFPRSVDRRDDVRP